MQTFEKLLSPIKIKYLDLKNRMVMAPMGTNYATREGFVTERLKDYYEERAKGGVGLIIVEAGCVKIPQGKILINQLGLYDDLHVSGLETLVQTIHRCGAKVAFQLHHAGLRAPREITGCQPVSASSIPVKGGESPKALSVREIKETVEAFAEAARRAKKADADAVEIHGAHGYLILNFLSPYSNKRKDAYGGDIERRTRFASEIVQAVRKNVGDDFPIFFRISAEEYVEGGLTLAETEIMAGILEKAGVDTIHVSSGSYDSPQAIIAPAEFAPGFRALLAKGIRENVSVPVIASGRINSPELAEEILEKEYADLISLGRALLADPEFPNKVILGKTSAIRRCIGCNQGCTGRMRELDEQGKSRMTCALNPTVGCEKMYSRGRAEKVKKILVAGGGPAGMEFALTASQRGHEVFLFEEDSTLGGQLELGSIPAYKREMENIIRYYEYHFSEIGVKVKLGKKVTPEVVAEVQPDVVILATGASPTTLPNCEITAWDVLRGRDVGDKVIVVGGGIVGCETAESLAEKGKEVVIIEKLSDIARDLEPLRSILLRKRLTEHKIETIVNAEIEKILEHSVIITGGKEIAADTIVVAVGAQANKELEPLLRGKPFPVYLVGDASKPRNLLDAIHGAYHLAQRL